MSRYPAQTLENDKRGAVTPTAPRLRGPLRGLAESERPLCASPSRLEPDCDEDAILRCRASLPGIRREIRPRTTSSSLALVEPVDLPTCVGPDLSIGLEPLRRELSWPVLVPWLNGRRRRRRTQSRDRPAPAMVSMSPAVPCGQGAMNDLHVLLRHRLLRQPHGFEGFRSRHARRSSSRPCRRGPGTRGQSGVIARPSRRPRRQRGLQANGDTPHVVTARSPGRSRSEDPRPRPRSRPRRTVLISAGPASFLAEYPGSRHERRRRTSATYSRRGRRG